MRNDEMEEGVLDDSSIPKNGIAIMIDKERFSYYMLGEIVAILSR